MLAPTPCAVAHQKCSGLWRHLLSGLAKSRLWFIRSPPSQDTPDVRVQIVVTLVTVPRRCISAALRRPRVRSETRVQGWVRREGQLLAGPLPVQVFLREAVLAVVVRGFDAEAVISRCHLEPVRLYNVLGSRDLGWATGLPVSRSAATAASAMQCRTAS
jgi:hypothetical protein